MRCAQDLSVGTVLVNIAGRATLALVGGLIVVGSVVVCGHLASLVAWTRLDPAIMQAALDKRVASQVARSALGHSAIPALLVLGLMVTCSIWPVSVRRGATYVAVGLFSNLTVQGVKHGVLPAPDSLNPLSGHAGVVAAVCLGWLAFTPERTRGGSLAAGAVVWGVSGGVILASWHTVPEVLCPLGIVTGWMVIGAAFAGRSVGGASEMRLVLASICVGTVALGVGLGLAQSRTAEFLRHSWAAPVLAEVIVAGATLLAVGVVLLARGKRYAPGDRCSRTACARP